MEEELIKFAATTFARAICVVPITEHDGQRYDALSGPASQPLPYEANARGEFVTSGMWALYLALIATQLDREPARLAARSLVMLEQVYDESAAPGWHDLIEAGIEALAELATPLPEGADRTTALHRFAQQVNAKGDAENSYDLIAIALDLDQSPSVARLACAQFGLALARSAGKSHQAAVMAAQVAAESIAADGATELSKRSFDACEEAVESIFLAPRPFDQVAARLLLSSTMGHPVLMSVVAPLGALIPELSEAREAMGLSHWPRRVQRLTTEEWPEEFLTILRALRYEHVIDAERLALDEAGQDRHASVDWISWALDHPAYRRAIPHNRSFLREAKFDEQILVLMHELTHAYSMLGGVGLALCALRVISFDNELHLWSIVARADTPAISTLMAEQVAAPLPDGQAVHLFRAERGLELTTKAQALQDVWTPWFEGLAVFAESAADPAMDPHGISPVAAALRNLIDFEPDDDADALAEFNEFVREFEDRVSGAVSNLGWRRLYSNVLLNGRDVYLAGYFSVRSILAAWRSTLGRAVSGPEAFTLLLHATRHGTFDAIPDLSLSADEFAKEAERAMALWGERLAKLGRATLEHFLEAPQRDTAGAPYVWRDGHLIQLVTDSEIELEHEREIQKRKDLLRQAEATLANQEDIAGFQALDDYCAILGSAAVKAVQAHSARNGNVVPEQQLLMVENHLVRGSLFALGHCSARFYLNIAANRPVCQFTTMLRTTEEHVETGRPSINMFSFPIKVDEAEELASAYLRQPRPRVEANRIIDLIGLLTPDKGRSYHFLAYQFDDWFVLRGATRTADAALQDSGARLSFARTRISRKLKPSAMDMAEQQLAQGTRCAVRTRDWIERSTAWLEPRLELAGDASAWATRVRDRADRLISQAGRAERWRTSGIALLGALWGERAARELVETDFLDLCSGFPAEAVARAIFETGAKPADTDWLKANGATFNRRAIQMFQHTPCGWDIRAPREG